MLPNTLQTWEKSTRKNNIDVQIVPKWKSGKLLACIHAVSFSFQVLDRRPYFTSSEFIYSFYSSALEGGSHLALSQVILDPALLYGKNSDSCWA